MVKLFPGQNAGKSFYFTVSIFMNFYIFVYFFVAFSLYNIFSNLGNVICIFFTANRRFLPLNVKILQIPTILVTEERNVTFYCYVRIRLNQSWCP